MQDIFGNDLFSLVNFDLLFEGYVLDNSNFESDGYLKVYIPELFVYDNIPDKALEYIENPKKSLIDNSDELLLSNNIKSCNYIKVYPQIHNYMENYLNDNLDEIKTRNEELEQLIQSSLNKIEKINNDESISTEEKTELINKEEAKILEYNDEKEDLIEQSNEYKESFYSKYKARIGQKVIVEFINGNPLLPYYKNKHLFNKEKYKFPVDILIKDYDIKIKETEQPNPEPEEEPIKYYYADRGFYRLISYKGNLDNLHYSSAITIDDDEGIETMFGDDILALNENLYKLGYIKVKKNKETFNTHYNKICALAVKNFQEWYNKNYENDKILVDAIVGPITFEKIVDEVLKGTIITTN